MFIKIVINIIYYKEYLKKMITMEFTEFSSDNEQRFFQKKFQNNRIICLKKNTIFKNTKHIQNFRFRLKLSAGTPQICGVSVIV